MEQHPDAGRRTTTKSAGEMLRAVVFFVVAFLLMCVLWSAINASGLGKSSDPRCNGGQSLLGGCGP